tara:strand:+ start:180 stop:332 length:153 start_codon:yes stop_codon:yes gene_type:complete
VSGPSPLDSDAYGIPERALDPEPDPDEDRDEDVDRRHADEEDAASDRATR